ncbi:diacylglycerol kinase family lipid kinase [Thermoleophilia bacterium SCSIO 60948]|nr:diacylglycerol kinase family lipid kinase [Thermoleophilia bacterium SCSIO 60948]
MSASRRLCVLCNPAAARGGSARSVEAIGDALRARGLETRIELTESGDHAAALAREATAAGEELIAFGGDGILRIAAHAARATGGIVGFLPGGRGNDFARVLGLPEDPIAACEVLVEGSAEPIDVGDVDGETFLGIASIGFDSEANRIANEAPKFLGSQVYTYAALRALATWRPACFDLELDGEPRSFTGYTAAVANSGRYGGGMRMAPDARLDDGVLDVVQIADASKLRFIREIGKVFSGDHVHLDNVSVAGARSVRLAADRAFDVYADGDRIGRTPALVRAVPSAIRFLMPAGALELVR